MTLLPRAFVDAPVFLLPGGRPLRLGVEDTEAALVLLLLPGGRPLRLGVEDADAALLLPAGRPRFLGAVDADAALLLPGGRPLRLGVEDAEAAVDLLLLPAGRPRFLGAADAALEEPLGRPALRLAGLFLEPAGRPRLLGELSLASFASASLLFSSSSTILCVIILFCIAIFQVFPFYGGQSSILACQKL